MILVGLGANLESRFGPPRQTLRAALGALAARSVAAKRLSCWYESAPVPASDQPWYVNAVASVVTDLPPRALLDALQEVEAALGRVRSVRNAARIVDLDVLDYHGAKCGEEGLDLPHPRLHERAFVLFPLRDVAPRWRHPKTGESVDTLIGRLPAGQQIRRSAEA